MRAAKNVPSSIKGVTLVELMVMSVIASLVAITVIQGFSGISKGIIASRFKSLGTQLANEKMQLIKSTPYYRLLVSSQTVVPTGLGSLTPTVQSDEFNHPPTVSIVNGVTFTAYTRVQRVAKNSAETLDVVSWNAPETGIKQITVDVVWTERNTLRRSRLINLLENSSRLVANGVFVGEVWNGTSFLPNALVETLEDSSLKVLSDAGGNYRLNAPVGTYTLRASKRGFFPKPFSIVSSPTRPHKPQSISPTWFSCRPAPFRGQFGTMTIW
ncbi:MAG: carboxypeptidase regulatory-like domain-containing protein [Elusimicrobia bacterium]|nr:carboxypeptidase regulatory-like domain-containing protein [Elusimicrobiota bacterium]